MTEDSSVHIHRHHNLISQAFKGFALELQSTQCHKTYVQWRWGIAHKIPILLVQGLNARLGNVSVYSVVI
jgi:hypothetical protein